MAIFHIPPPRKWSHKHIILVTLVGSLVFIAITAAIAISLSPAHIFFSIKDPTFANKADEDTKFYNFTLVVNNSSPGMEVHYGALSAELWYSDKARVPAKVDRGALLDDGTRQPPRNVTSIAVSADGGTNGNGIEWPNCTVLVTASVWFKSRWWISTRWYDVRANCTPVNFGSHSTSPVSCE
ncbi:hypothetical protein PAHAL_3G059900 [Panicum hallii]|jgi:hypothetical protein|uniref:Late embryogenesis abundant protein LEA-2 subgroup domain-containing protein n=1 Tax=Panicum hallii TaxID=206008 RepID=A0A2T8KHC4_9POAL|nr:hypothetical protein PAHAL_3G059900 [Panicum hallii]